MVREFRGNSTGVVRPRTCRFMIPHRGGLSPPTRALEKGVKQKKKTVRYFVIPVLNLDSRKLFIFGVSQSPRASSQPQMRSRADPFLVGILSRIFGKKNACVFFPLFFSNAGSASAWTDTTPSFEGRTFFFGNFGMRLFISQSVGIKRIFCSFSKSDGQERWTKFRDGVPRRA
jgi:hypothetical protein